MTDERQELQGQEEDKSFLEFTPEEIAIARGEDPSEASELLDGDGHQDGEQAGDGADGGGADGDAEYGDAEYGDEQYAEGDDGSAGDGYDDSGYYTDSRQPKGERQDTDGGGDGLPREVLEEAATYGLGAEELQGMDEASARRLLNAFGKQFFNAGKEQFEQQAQRQQQERQHQQQAQPQDTADSSQGQGDADSADDLPDPEEMRREGIWDEETIQLVEKMKEVEQRYKQELQQREQALQQTQQQFIIQEVQREVNAFHDHADALDPERFGKSIDDAGKPVQLSDKHKEARTKLGEAYETLKAGFRARGQQLPPQSVLIRRAHAIAFGDDIRKQERNSISQNLRRQSRRRLGTPARSRATPQARQSTYKDEVQELANNPELKELWDRFHNEQ